MEIDRPHFRTSTTASSTAAVSSTTELFICFSSRLSSSSSMKLTKSILSPARDGTAPVSLSSSLSRRLRTNGSLKGGASPFFTTTGKKRGCGFDNPEPSSPKVTCIGQVRVKTKKKVKQSRSLSRRRSGDFGFRKIDQVSSINGNEDKGSDASAHYQQPPQECLPHRNQRWVHLPISICEALKDFNCLFPCKGSCFSTNDQREKAEKLQNVSNGNENGCGAVFARWLVSVNDGEGGRRREIELVVGGEDEEEQRMSSMRSSRRHVFEDILVKDDKIEVKGQSVETGEEPARVSICIPPKNALLLMRCRSDPVKMAAHANRFSWDAAAHAAGSNGNEDDIEEEEEANVEQNGLRSVEEDEVTEYETKDEIFLEEKDVKVDEVVESDVIFTSVDEQGIRDEAEEANLEMEANEEELVEGSEEMVAENRGGEVKKEIEVDGSEGLVEEEEEEVESNMDSFEALLDQENTEQYEDCCHVQDNEEAEENPICRLSPSTESDQEEIHTDGKVQPFPEESVNGEENAIIVHCDEENQALPEETALEEEQIEPSPEVERTENQEMLVGKDEKPKNEKGSPVLPECLLLMMCEPKLSMEVSEETWVCSTDFIRWLPERPAKPAKAPKPGGFDKRRLSTDTKPKSVPRADQNHFQQPPRSSCSLPAAAAAASMAAVIEQKLARAVGYEPFVLTRCKSEPMRTAAAKLLPESYFWKNATRKLEPHRRTTIGVGVGAAGVGF